MDAPFNVGSHYHYAADQLIMLLRHLEPNPKNVILKRVRVLISDSPGSYILVPAMAAPLVRGTETAGHRDGRPQHNEYIM